MIIVILAICLGLIALGIFCLVENHDMAGGIATGAGIMGFIISLIVCICLIISVSGLGVIDQKIEMYQEENTKIEEQIAATVKQYQEYETDIFTAVSPDESSIVLVSLYPELKADTLVQSQIEIYTANNEKIKSLREQKINGTVDRWWLYFGG
jgi:hypothetical protein